MAPLFDMPDHQTPTLIGHPALMARFVEAWGRRDVDGVAACFAEDGVYGASVGPEPGETFAGRTAIRTGVALMFTHDAGAQMAVDTPVFGEDWALVTWTYSAADPSGSMKSTRGCDIFRFRGDKIVLKDAFRKTTA